MPQEEVAIPDWVWEFHGHRCPFMPIGYRMGKLALKLLGVEREADHGLFVFSEMGIGHPQSCMMDGLQAATGATYGKNMMTRLHYGKVAAVVWKPGRPAVRLYLRNEAADAMGRYEFFRLRQQGVEPSRIPPEVAAPVVDFVLSQADEELFKVTELPDFTYRPVKGSFNKGVCEVCGEYVFERYLRWKDGKRVCIACSGYETGPDRPEEAPVSA